ncbi:hypothetical protein JVU11DRAFT_9599 [Chiua virens]|nr:hypothetical protein JVU11DRAFT_9599 [Chiua virens]
MHQVLGNQAQDIIRSATDTVLETLKDENKDFNKKRDQEEILGGISSYTFSQLVALSKKIADYGAEDKQMVDPDVERKDAEIDEEISVAVVLVGMSISQRLGWLRRLCQTRIRPPVYDISSRRPFR